MRRALIFLCSTVLAACATTKVAPPSVNWQSRASDLQRASAWQLDGRAAVAVGTQGWQATLDWQQADNRALVHLAGPFGIGALVLKQEPEGLSVNGAPPSDAVLSQLQDRLGFELPLDYLRFWLLGVPDPAISFELSRNDQDRARQLTQGGWSIVYDRYLTVDGDLLPGRLILSRDAVRVRVVIDHWNWPR
jgi:outer membrane lipoprotein LolB